jgi:DNA recombination protein RmuC
MTDTLQLITTQNHSGIEQINKTLDEKINALIVKVEGSNKENRETITSTLKEFSSEQKQKFDELKNEQKESAKNMEKSLKVIHSFRCKLTQGFRSKLTHLFRSKLTHP